MLASLSTATSIKSSDDRSLLSLLISFIYGKSEGVGSLKGEFYYASVSKFVIILSNDSSERITLDESALELINSYLVTTSKVFS